MSETVLILGASSGIGRAFARRLAEEGASLVLAGRRTAALEALAADVAVRHETATRVLAYDALAFGAHEALLDEAFEGAAPPLRGVVLCQGDMPEQAEAEADPARARAAFDVNATSAIALCEAVARRLEAARGGWLCALTSVAGDRGRRKNYLYGAGKAALQTALEGLGARCARAGVTVTDVRPGFVDTGLTFARPDLPLLASPERVARDALRAVRRGRSRVYTPAFWWPVMALLRILPSGLFRRLDL